MKTAIKFLYGLQRFVDPCWFLGGTGLKAGTGTFTAERAPGDSVAPRGAVDALRSVQMASTIGTLRQAMIMRRARQCVRDTGSYEPLWKVVTPSPVNADTYAYVAAFAVGGPILPLLVYGGKKLYCQVRDGLFQISPRGGAAPRGDAVISLPAGYSSGAELLQGGGPAAPSGVVFTRLRPRARWVRALEACLGGRKGCVAAFVGRRWRPDLPDNGRPCIQNYLLGSIEGGARLLGGGVAAAKGEEDENPADRIYFIVDSGSGGELVFPALLGNLRTYALFRKRDRELCGALRTRAQGWCKGVGLRPHIMDMAVAGAVPMAMMPSTHEILASSRAHEAVQKANHLAPPLLS